VTVTHNSKVHSNNPYHEDMQNATTKTLEPVLQRSSIILPDLMPDRQSKNNMANKR